MWFPELPRLYCKCEIALDASQNRKGSSCVCVCACVSDGHVYGKVEGMKSINLYDDSKRKAHELKFNGYNWLVQAYGSQMLYGE